MATQAPYMPVHVGKALHPEMNLGIQGDDTGDNISFKNESYCELTGMYWAWKNLQDIDIVGLCHYRRYFDLSDDKDIDREPYAQNCDIPFANGKVINKILKKYDIIVPGNSYIFESVWDSYAIGHSRADIVEVEKAIQKCYPEYINSFDAAMKKRNYYCGCNMMICKKRIFDDYCEWLFTILKEVERNVDISNYDTYQRRIFGFMSERLLGVFLLHNNYSICHRPIIKLTEDKTPTRIKQIFHKLKANLCFALKK